MDPITQIVEDHVTITATRDGVTRVVQRVVPYRLWTATEVLAAVRLSGRLQNRRPVRRLRPGVDHRPRRLADDHHLLPRAPRVIMQ